MSKEEFARTVKAFGPGRKDADNDGLLFFPELAAGSGLRIFGFKDRCCERIQVGTKVIPAREETVLPAAPEQVIPVYEWHCAPFLETPEPAEVTA